MPVRRLVVPLLVLTVVPALAVAQAKRASPTEPATRAPASRAPAADATADVPKDMIPPAGKCRIWMRGVPAAQQPAPTDCTTALRQAPSNGVLVFGPALRDLSPFEARRSELRTQQAERGRQAAARSGRDSGGRASDTAATRRRPATTTERGTKATTRDGATRETKSREPATRSPSPPPPPPRQPRRPDRPE